MSAPHLSAFKVSRVASGALRDDERQDIDAHLASCAACTERVRLERVDVDAAALEPIPARILAARPTPKTAWWSSWKLWVPGLVAVAAAVLIVVVPKGDTTLAGGGDEGGIRMKGAIAIEATVSRGDTIAMADTKLDALGPLQAGDRVLLRVRNGEGQLARVASFEGGAWVSIHESVVPAEGWLALALKVTPGETRLRVTVCPDATTSDCFEQAQTLDVK